MGLRAPCIPIHRVVARNAARISIDVVLRDGSIFKAIPMLEEEDADGRRYIRFDPGRDRSHFRIPPEWLATNQPKKGKAF